MSKNKKGKVVNFQPISLDRYIKEKARKLPFGPCYISDPEPEELKQVIISRRKQSGKLLVGFYLIDTLCLGLKETFFKECDEDDELESLIEDIEMRGIDPFEKKDPVYLQNLIYGAIEWAEDAGIKPNRDFKVTEYLLDSVEELEYVEIEFGRKGRHTYFEGPYDNTSKILKTLEENLGEGNFDFVGEFDDADEAEFDDDMPPNFEERYEMKVLEIDAVMEDMGNEHFFVYLNKYFGDEISEASSMFMVYYFFANAVWEKMLETHEFRYFFKENKESNLKVIESIIEQFEELYRKNLDSFSLRNFIEIENVIFNNILFEGPNWTLLPEFANFMKVFSNLDKQDLGQFIDFMANPTKKYGYYFQKLSIEIAYSENQEINEATKRQYFKKALDLYEQYNNGDLEIEIEDQFFYFFDEIDLISNYYDMPSSKKLYESAYMDDRWE